ncbi:response regulator, partial [Parabacteroides sp. OttesenSCG-928-O15]|nr:response regulator [Parabacteroides sp. OttesenSCG-928-O15]
MKNILFLLFTLTCCASLWAESNSLSLHFPAVNNQLPSNTVQRLYQDKSGFMWLGTLDGLCRYDAYQLLVFRSDLQNPQLLTNNEISGLVEDMNNNLLIATAKGVNIMDLNTYQIRPFESTEIAEQNIHSIHVTRDSIIWVGTSNRLFSFNADFSFRKQYDDMPLSSINSISEDNEGNLWISIWYGGIYKYDKKNDRFISYPRIGRRNNPFKVFQDNVGAYWVCTWDDGLFLFDPKEEEEKMFSPIRIYNEWVDRNMNFFSITQDDQLGYIWVMSSQGLHVFDRTEEGELHLVDVSYLFQESNNIFSEITKDRSGNLWIGTFDEGFLTIDFNKSAIENYVFPEIKQRTGFAPNVTSIYKDENDKLWLNQNRWGLFVYDLQKDQIAHYRDIPLLRNKHGLNIVNYIARFRSMPETIWLASDTRLVIYSIKTEKGGIVSCTEIPIPRTDVPSGNVQFFFEDRQNNIWIVATNTLFLKPYNQEEIIPVIFSLGTVNGMAEDTRGNLWVSTKTQGLYKLIVSPDVETGDVQAEKFSTKAIPLSDNLEGICADLKGRLWIGTKEGNIIMYDVVSDSFTDLSAAFMLLNEEIIFMLVDDYGHVWVATNKRVIEYNPENQALRDYTTTDGIAVSSFRNNAYFKDSSGKLYLGGNNGVSALHPSKQLASDSKKIETFISDIKINNQSLFQHNNNDKFNYAKQELRLEPDDQNLEINFSTLDYTFAPKIKYAYKLSGVDNDWIYTEKDRRFAIYNQLKKGKHTFYIKATDENNLWSDHITQLSIYKRPAFYETNWAYAFYLSCLLLGLYLIVRWQRNRTRLQNELRFAQIEKEKSEELTQLKLRYFTNISHDFLTPLTILSCLIDDAEITSNGKITQFKAMRSNINRLRRLLQQVLDFRKVESGNMKLTLSHGDMANYVKQVCFEHFVPLMEKKEIEFCFKAEPDQIEGYFDTDKLDKIIYNLLSNAEKYTQEKGRVELELTKKRQNNKDYLSVKVSDTGVGITPENLPRIFTRFYNNDMKIDRASNGIGLSVTKDLVELHHGTISVTSQPGVGSIFHVEIPIDKESYEERDSASSVSPIVPTEKNVKALALDELPDTPPEPNSLNEIEKMTILIVEDNLELLSLISGLLSRSYQVITAHNGLEALSMVKENNIDIIVSDVMMPEMDGFELCITLKKDIETSHIPIILLTAKNSTEDRIECYNAGADAYISKPFQLKVLEARIRNFLSNRKTKQKEFQSDVEVNISKLEYQTIDEQFLMRVIKLIEENLSEAEFDVNTLAASLHISKSSLYRKIKMMTGLSPVEFIRNIRLKHACQLLKNEFVSIAEVTYQVGFSDPRYFATCFKNEFQITPSEYQK